MKPPPAIKANHPAKELGAAQERAKRQPGLIAGKSSLECTDPVYVGWHNMGGGKRRRGKSVGNF